jgi:HAD superfamily hydrolase (TIGR01662 family)
MASDQQGVIFDLDQTLVDSATLETLRKARRWREVYGRLGDIVPYEGILPLIHRLRSAGIRVGIVTSSPHSYCSKVMSACQFEVDACVCYHDTKLKKPHPEPMLLALEKLGSAAKMSVAVGDSPNDIAAANGAGIYSVAAAWGCINAKLLHAAKPDILVTCVIELDQLLTKRFGLPVGP